jgi:hypothetical protein
MFESSRDRHFLIRIKTNQKRPVEHSRSGLLLYFFDFFFEMELFALEFFELDFIRGGVIAFPFDFTLKRPMAASEFNEMRLYRHSAPPIETDYESGRHQCVTKSSSVERHFQTRISMRRTIPCKGLKTFIFPSPCKVKPLSGINMAIGLRIRNRKNHD